MRSFFAVCFIANLLALIVVLSVDGAKPNQTPVPAKKDDNKISEAIESIGKKLEQLIDVVNATSHKEPGPSFANCRDIYKKYQSQDNKAYQLKVNSWNVPVYCHMTTGLGACGGGGWTLVMKIDGHKPNFHYNSGFWSNMIEFNLPGGKTGFDSQETKLPTYWKTPFSKICLGMKINNQLNFIVINQHANSLYSLIADGAYRATSLGRNTWKTLIGAQASLQQHCNREGFNVLSDKRPWSKARIGILANNENQCASCDSRIGFGTGGLHDDSNTCGNEAIYGADNGDKHIKAMGYILVQ